MPLLIAANDIAQPQNMYRSFAFLSLLLAACAGPKTDQKPEEVKKGTFAYDEEFLKKYKKVHVLSSGDARVIVIGDYQARVMTSTAGGPSGNSYGWINYDLIASARTLPHINPVGGEDRFWLGPEGGQFALYFNKGDEFVFEKWQTPAVIDTEPFDLVSADSTQTTYRRSATVTNYSGTQFQMNIDRQVRLMDAEEIAALVGTSPGSITAVGFQTVNTVTNAGPKAWTAESGMPSIWILGMFNPTPGTTVIIPFKASPNRDKLITDDYFGKIPADRLVKRDSFLLFKGDGANRGKLGIAPGIAREIAGSFDADKNILTLVGFDISPDAAYVNSKWETQKEPFKGDAVNSYNDGPLEGGGQLGPFYEIESSSPALALKPGESKTHTQTTIHLEGDLHMLDQVATRLLGVSLLDLQARFRQ